MPGEGKVTDNGRPRSGKTTAVQEALEKQPSGYFSPHPGLTFISKEGRVIGCNDLRELTKLQIKIFDLLNQKQDTWCTWEELEACFPPPKKWKVIYKKVRSKDKTVTNKPVTVRYTDKDRKRRVQKEIGRLKATIRDVHRCKSLIVYKRNIQAYRLTASTACSLSPGCC